MICINLYGGMATGKSTIAAFVFGELKTRGILCELVGSFPKTLAYNRAYRTQEYEKFTFAHQEHRLEVFKDFGLQVAICDYPLLQAIAWKRKENGEFFDKMVIEAYKKYNNMDFFLKRNNEFWFKDNRYGDFNEASKSDAVIKQLLEENSDSFEELNPNGYKTAVMIADKVEEILKKVPPQCMFPYIEDGFGNRVTPAGDILDNRTIYK